MIHDANLPPAGVPAVSWAHVVKFVRQLSHDLRNNLNAMELQSAFLAEIAETAEQKGEVKRLRAMTAEFSERLEKITSAMSQVNLQRMRYKAGDFMEDLGAKIAAVFPAEREAVLWKSEMEPGAMLDIDPQILQQAFVEILGNAFQHARGPGLIEVSATTSGEKMVVTITEPKSSLDFPVEDWGRQPLQTVKAGKYGLGLFRSRTLIEAHGGTFMAERDLHAMSLVTTIVLPLLSGVGA